MIRLAGVGLRLGTFELADLSLEVPAGGYGLILGPTGAGKTSLLEAVAGHLPVQRGAVFLNGREVTREPPEARGIGFVYQAYHLFPHFSVRDNIRYGLGRRADPATPGRRVDELARLLELADLLDRGVGGLSGGEQQRVALARALAPRPRILLLDEPFAAVDPSLRRALRRTLRELQARERVTTLHVTHDVEDALRLGDLVAVLARGRIVQSGPPEQVFRYPSTPFVAEFLGSGTVLRGRIERVDPTEGESRPFAARFLAGTLALEVVAEREGPAQVLIRPEEVLLSREALPRYPRNRFRARVVALERQGPVTQVQVAAGEHLLLAAIMGTTALEQNLVPGVEVNVGIKATAIHLF